MSVPESREDHADVVETVVDSLRAGRRERRPGAQAIDDDDSIFRGAGSSRAGVHAARDPTADRLDAWLGTAFVALHGVVNAAHGTAHGALGVELSPWQKAFVLVAIGLSPFAAAALLWTARARLGALLLVASMAAAFVFGVYYHYVTVSPDHVDHLPPGDAQGLFRVSAVLVAASQALGVVLGLWSHRRLRA